ncbi:hypothetical protein [Clostridium oryzae]|nr:hypothetical protein [Clostridium oryzae]
MPCPKAWEAALYTAREPLAMASARVPNCDEFIDNKYESLIWTR